VAPVVRHSFSASSISAINKTLDESLRAFAERRLSDAYPYLILDVDDFDHHLHTMAALDTFAEPSAHYQKIGL
jgi:hypothetical protein